MSYVDFLRVERNRNESSYQGFSHDIEEYLISSVESLFSTYNHVVHIARKHAYPARRGQLLVHRLNQPFNTFSGIAIVLERMRYNNSREGSGRIAY